MVRMLVSGSNSPGLYPSWGNRLLLKPLDKPRLDMPLGLTADLTICGESLTDHLIINNIIIGRGFCDVQNYRGQSKGYQLKPKAEADNPH